MQNSAVEGSADDFGPEQFLRGLFGAELPDDTRLIVWSTKSVAWCSSIEQAISATKAIDASSEVDVYFGCSLQDPSRAPSAPDDKKRRPRGEASTTRAIGGIWLDVDFATAHHKKKDLPPTQADAESVIAALPMQPTVTLWTGGGLHAWWMLREPFLIETDDDRSRAATAVRGWNLLASDLMHARGWTMDVTSDLARVLRLPGTRNRKYNVIVRASRVALERTYNLSDFDQWAFADEKQPIGARFPKAQVATISVAGLTFAPNANPPIEKFQRMSEFKPGFKSTWENARKELPSASERDLSLATHVVGDDWTDQEAIDLMIACRRKHGDDLKLRPDYYARTMAKARAAKARDAAMERLASGDLGAEPADAIGTPVAASDGSGDADVPFGGDPAPRAPASRPRAPTTGTSAALLKDVSALLGLEIRAVLRYSGEPAIYRLVLADGSIDLGGVEAILSLSTFRARVADVTRRVLPRMKPTRWDTVAQALLRACEDVDLGPESSHERSTVEILQEYLARFRPTRNKDDACRQKLPLVFDGAVLVHLGHLKHWVGIVEGDKIKRSELARRLRMCGSSPRIVNYQRTNGGATTCSAWELAENSWTREIVANAPDAKPSNREPGDD